MRFKNYFPKPQARGEVEINERKLSVIVSFLYCRTHPEQATASLPLKFSGTKCPLGRKFKRKVSEAGREW